MTRILYAAMLAVLVGCSQDASSLPTGPDEAHGTTNMSSYSEALRVYRDELEILNHLEESERIREAKFQDDLDRIFYESNLTPDEAEEMAKPVSAKSREERLASEREIEKQRERVERAKAAVDAAEERKKR